MNIHWSKSKMPTYEITSPDGVTLEIQGDQPPTEDELNNIFSQYQVKEEEPGIIDSIADAFTGESKETRATEELPELPEAAGFLSSENPLDVAKVAPALLTTTEPQEMADILKENFPNIGIQYDEKGNIIAGNNATGDRVVLNKPGMSKMDIANILGIGSLATAASVVAPAASGAAKVAQAAGQSGAMTSAMEGAQAALGGDFDASNVVIDMLTAGAGEAVPAYLKHLIGKKDTQAAGLVDEAVTAEASRVADDLSPEAQGARQTELLSDVAKQAQKGAPDVSQIASDVAPRKEITEAAERLDIADSLTPAQTSGSQQYREIEGALAAVPGSQLSAQQAETYKQIGKKADELITEFGGTLDKSDLSESLKTDVLSHIDTLGKSTEKVYSEVNAAIPKQASVDLSTLTKDIEQEAIDLQGVENLEPLQKRILEISEGGQPSYALVDKIRKQVGQAIGKGQGAFKDQETGMLKNIYSKLTDAQELTASDHGAGELWEAGKALTKQRKELEDHATKLMGKDLSGSIMPKIGGAMKKLSKGDYGDYDRMMKSIPPSRQQEVVLTALNDVFRNPQSRDKSLNPTTFSKWYEDLNRNSAAKKRIVNYLPDEAKQRLEDIYQVSKGISDASQQKVKTGIVKAFFDDFDKQKSMLNKIYQVAGPAVSAIPGAQQVSAVANLIAQPKTPISEAADKMIASAKFKDSVKAYADRSVRARVKQKAADTALLKSAKYKKWLSLLPEDDQRQIMRAGLMTWLGGTENEEE